MFIVSAECRIQKIVSASRRKVSEVEDEYVCFEACCTGNQVILLSPAYSLWGGNFYRRQTKFGLGQGNVFTGVCLSTGGSIYDVTSCLAAWSRVPSRGVSVPGPMFLPGGWSL